MLFLDVTRLLIMFRSLLLLLPTPMLTPGVSPYECSTEHRFEVSIC